MDKKIIKHRWCMIYTLFLISLILIRILCEPLSTFWWWFTLICCGGAIVVGATYLGYDYLIHYINKQSGDDNG